MSPAARRNLGLMVGVGAIIALCVIFPRVLAFVELAARELRYLWWLVVILALGIWLAFFLGKNRD
ncbi:MAG: hypothetical protein EXS41_09345 [Opitutaceae bacterium]|jgi:hypothetical protein|nr:hypothetical protein [Opitutaceae bacterium]